MEDRTETYFIINPSLSDYIFQACNDPEEFFPYPLVGEHPDDYAERLEIAKADFRAAQRYY